MDPCLSTTSHLRSTERTRQGTISNGSLPVAKQQSRHIESIHILDDDSLLNIFYFYRPFFLGEGGKGLERLYGGVEPWEGHWWYRLAHVCQRWRNLLLESASYLGLSLVCTTGTPVANMIARSPPLPLTVDYRSGDAITAEDEKGILLALEQHDRLRHLRLILPAQNLQKLVMAIDEEFPILEYLVVGPWTYDTTVLMLPETLHAPALRHLTLGGFTYPIRPRLYPTALGLVTLYLTINHLSAYFQPNILLQWISFMPRLECLALVFTFPIHNRNVERQITPNTPITLPNLRLFWFRGVSAYLEAVVCRIVAPRLENLLIRLFKGLTFSVPRLPQFMNTTDNLRFDNAVITLHEKQIDLVTYLREADTYAFAMTVDCWHLGWQALSSVAQILNALSQVFSSVEHLTLQNEVYGQSFIEHNNNDRIRVEWRRLLRSFSNVKTLCVGDGLVQQLSCCLGLEDGELPLVILPELKELTYSGRDDADDVFTSFIDARQNTRRQVTLIRHSSSLSNSMLSTKAASTLLRSLTFQYPGFPETESIWRLIETIGLDVVQFRRNTRISYLLIDRARSTCDLIDKALIQRTDYLENFFKYKAAIDSLVRVLLDSATTTQDEARRYLCEGKDIDRWIESITAWDTNRRNLQAFLYSFRVMRGITAILPMTSDEEMEMIKAGKHDDASFLLELHQSIKNHAFRQRAEGFVSQLVELVNDKLADLYALAQSGVLQDLLIVPTIKAAMLILGIMDICIDSQVDKKRTHHLELETFWDAAHSLLVFLHEMIAEDPDNLMKLTAERFEAFLLVFETIPDVLLPFRGAQGSLMEVQTLSRKPT